MASGQGNNVAALIPVLHRQLTQGCENDQCTNDMCLHSRNRRGLPLLTPQLAAITALNALNACKGDADRQVLVCPPSLTHATPMDTQAEEEDNSVSAPSIDSTINDSSAQDSNPIVASTSKDTSTAPPPVATAPANPEAVKPSITLDLDYLKQLQASGDPPMRHLGTVLTSQSILNRAFECPSTEQTPHKVNLDDVDSAYQMFTEMGISDPVTNTMARFLDTLASTTSATIVAPSDMRFILIFLQNPSFHDPHAASLILKPLFLKIWRLPTRLQDTLVDWFATYTRPRYDTLVYLTQTYMTLRIVEGMATKMDDATRAGLHFLSLLWKANLKLKWYGKSHFFNDVINSYVPLEHEYIMWEKGEPYSLPSYSWILEPATKQMFLQLDAEIQMYRALRGFDALFSRYLVIRVRREYLIHDALLYISSRKDQLKKSLKVVFEGEEGIDEGGVKKEFFQLVIKELFDPKYGMFIFDETLRTYWFNPCSPSGLDEFELIGIVLGLAIYNSVILPLSFPKVVWKKLLGDPTTIEDLRDVVALTGDNLQKMLDTPGMVESLDLNFVITTTQWDNVVEVPLVEGGADKKVTEENKQEYVDAYVDYLLNTSIKQQYQAFHDGFHAVCGGKALKLFEPSELELLVCGNPFYDFQALQQATTYEGYTEHSQVVQWFWQTVHEMSDDMKKRLLFFTTGSDRIPINGLSSMPFIIQKAGGEADLLPAAHTCFNVLLLPEYTSQEQLRAKLHKALENAEGFGMI